jgi:hypothetical protein
MIDKHWFEYVKSCYDLVIESENMTRIILNDTIEAYIVHLMAKNFNRTDIGTQPVALQVMQAMQSNNTEILLSIADECLLINAYPLRKNKWPTLTYYQDMGITCYGLAHHTMEKHFIPASIVLSAIFTKMHPVA